MLRLWSQNGVGKIVHYELVVERRDGLVQWRKLDRFGWWAMAKEVDMLAVPSALARLREREDASEVLAEEIGSLVRTLAASKLGGVAMQLGTGNPEVGTWLLDGMDITCRLIVLVDDTADPTRVKMDLGDDIRVAVHQQEASAFMDDIKAHRFQLLVFDSPPASKEILSLALGLLEFGAILMILDAQCHDGVELEDVLRYLAGDERVHSVNVLGAGRMIVSVRRPDVAKPVRRGARRARHQRAEQQ